MLDLLRPLYGEVFAPAAGLIQSAIEVHHAIASIAYRSPIRTTAG